MSVVYHEPALLSQTIEGLHIQAEGIYVDATFGGGGHSRVILSCLNEKGRLYAFDQDEDAQKNVLHDERFSLIQENFQYMRNFLRMYGITQVDGILADLGVSSHQFDFPERGFSIRTEGPLDMRMDQRQSLTAAQLIATYEKEALADVFYYYGELPQSRKIAQKIIEKREEKPIQTTTDLMDCLRSFAPRGRENKFFAMLFQALRIEVNQEMQVLRVLLEQSLSLLKPQGRLVVISYHSLEDRLVKNFMRSGNLEGNIEKDFYGNLLSPFRLVTRKAIMPNEEEIAQNPRVRSAKLRIAEKIEEINGKK